MEKLGDKDQLDLQEFRELRDHLEQGDEMAREDPLVHLECQVQRDRKVL